MNVYELPDGRLVVPRRVTGDGIIGDGMVVLEKDDPEYKLWMDDLIRTGDAPTPIDKWED